MAGERADGFHAAHPGPGEAAHPARRSEQRAPATLRELALWPRLHPHLRSALPAAPPVLRLRDRQHRRDPGRFARRRAAVPPPVLRPEQRLAHPGRRLRFEHRAATHRQVFRTDPARSGRSQARSEAASAQFRRPRKGRGQARTASALRIHLERSQAIRRRGSARRRARRRAGERPHLAAVPVVGAQGAGGEQRGRVRQYRVAGRLDLDRRDGEARSHSRGAEDAHPGSDRRREAEWRHPRGSRAGQAEDPRWTRPGSGAGRRSRRPAQRVRSVPRQSRLSAARHRPLPGGDTAVGAGVREEMVAGGPAHRDGSGPRERRKKEASR